MGGGGGGVGSGGGGGGGVGSGGGGGGALDGTMLPVTGVNRGARPRIPPRAGTVLRFRGRNMCKCSSVLVFLSWVCKYTVTKIKFEDRKFNFSQLPILNSPTSIASLPRKYQNKTHNRRHNVHHSKFTSG